MRNKQALIAAMLSSALVLAASAHAAAPQPNLQEKSTLAQASQFTIRFQGMQIDKLLA